MTMEFAKISLQDQHTPNSRCYGCGPSNPNGFQLKSFVQGEKIIAHYLPKEYHQAFPNVLNGGVIGTLLDCHCAWAGAYYLMREQKLNKMPCVVTAEYTIRLLRPTPVGIELTLEARLIRIDKNRAIIKGKICIDNTIYDMCRGTFVAIDESHSTIHRW